MYAQYTYLICLLIGVTGLTIIDWRYKLALFKFPKQTILVLLICITFFVAWDAAGIGLGIFFSGHSRYMLNRYIFSDFPPEELLFLLVLCYTPLVAYLYLEKKRV